jgi:hypothetical protein
MRVLLSLAEVIELTSVWGRLATCGGLAARQRRLPIGAQDSILPHEVS